MQSLTIKILFVFFVSIVPVTEAAAQTAHKLSGVITDEFNHPLVGTTVQLMNTQKRTTTDRHGAFIFNNLD